MAGASLETMMSVNSTGITKRKARPMPLLNTVCSINLPLFTFLCIFNNHDWRQVTGT